MSPGDTLLTLSVVSHGQGELLAQLLDDLARCPTARAARVLVTLNQPHEPFDAGRHPALRIEVLRPARPRGFGANHNAAFARCDTHWFAVLNPDLRLPRDPFPALLDAARRHPDAALLAPHVLGPDGVTPEDAVRGHLSPGSLLARHFFGRRRLPPPDTPARRGGAFFWMAGMCLMLRSDAFHSLGGFDERFFMYCEDCDLSVRLWLAGHALLPVPGAQVVHAARRASRRSLRSLGWHLTSLGRLWTSAAYRELSRELARH